MKEAALPDPEPDIVVVGRRLDEDIIIDAWLFSESYYEPYPVISPIPSEPQPQVSYVNYRAQCNSVASLAKNLGKYLQNNVVASGGAEFSAVGVGAGGGQFQIYLDNFVTSNNVGETSLITPHGMAANVVLLFHNHPGGLQSNQEDYNKLNRYPSTLDWASFTSLVNSGDAPASVNIAIQAPDGSVRIFNYADKAQYENLTQAERIAGVNLPPEVASDAGCTQ